MTIPNSTYQEHGFSNRDEYLDSLRDTYGADAVNAFISFMPPSEDFDGLVTDLQDYVSGDGFYAMCNAELDGGKA
tara:strand:- start:505 stop:729 length:225 start_codon:yes stop_codon:yes gene_type:complete